MIYRVTITNKELGFETAHHFEAVVDEVEEAYDLGQTALRFTKAFSEGMNDAAEELKDGG